MEKPFDGRTGLEETGSTSGHNSVDPFPQSHVRTPAVGQTNPGRNGSAFWGGLFWLLATGIMIAFAWFLGPQIIERYQYAATKGRVTAEYENATNILAQLPLHDVSQAFQLVAQKIKPSVVSIQVPATNRKSRLGSKTNLGGQGSGVIMSSDGYLLTNNHVVNGAKTVEVGLHDRRRFTGVVVGSDPASDLAVIKIDAKDLLPAEWGDSDYLNVGSMVWAVGSPYGLEQTVTSGILSAKERGDEEGTEHKEYLQTDAAVNPGNSGGPLVNARGQVVGINTSIYGEKFQGISFAIPSVIAKFVFDQIIDNGTVTRSFLGINPTHVTQEHMNRHRLPDLNGALVTYLSEGGPAEQSGILVGDVIRKWGEHDVLNYNMLYRHIAMSAPDKKIGVDLIRDGRPVHLLVSVVERPSDSELSRTMTPGSQRPRRN